MVPCSRVNECPPEHVQEGIHSPSGKSQKGIHSPSNMGVFLGCFVSGWILWAVCSICWVCVCGLRVCLCGLRLFVGCDLIIFLCVTHLSAGDIRGRCWGTGTCQLITHTGDDRSYAYTAPTFLPCSHAYIHHTTLPPPPVIHPTHHPTALHV
jgi:hypothetical protein